MTVNVYAAVQPVIQTRSITEHVNVDLKIIVSAKTIIVGILAHVFERIANSENVLLILYLTCVMKL